MGAEWYLLAVLTSVSLIKHVEHLFMCLLVIFVSSLKKCSFRSFAHFVTGKRFHSPPDTKDVVSFPTHFANSPIPLGVPQVNPILALVRVRCCHKTALTLNASHKYQVSRLLTLPSNSATESVSIPPTPGSIIC